MQVQQCPEQFAFQMLAAGIVNQLFATSELAPSRGVAQLGLCYSLRVLSHVLCQFALLIFMITLVVVALIVNYFSVLQVRH